MSTKKILITGASGFIGKAMVNRALSLDFETWAGVRASSSRDGLQDGRLHFIDLHYDDVDALTNQLREAGRFDYIVHVAGITKALHKSAFEKINFEYVKSFIDALIASDTVPDLFVFMSTLGAVGVCDEEHYTPIRSDATPNPNTAYGKSKLRAETYLRSKPAFPFVILRPTGVYGPHDKDYLILIRGIARGVTAGAGFKKQLLSFIYIDDLVNIIFACIDKKTARNTYVISDGACYTDTEFNRIVQKILQKKHLLQLRLPLFIVKTAAHANETLAKLLGKTTTFNSDKYRIIKQRNWACDISDLQRDIDFAPDYPLEKGLAKTIAWYHEKKWL